MGKKMFKIMGRGLWGRGGGNSRGGGEFKKKICKRHKYHPKMDICSKFNLNRKMGKYLKIGGKVCGVGRWGGNF